MVDSSAFKLEALITIVDSHLSDLQDLFRENNMPISLLTYGYGSAKSVVYDILVTEAQKIISISLKQKICQIILWSNFTIKLI